LNKKLKIAIIGSRGYPYVYSGYETLVKELSERLVAKGHSVRVYCHYSLFSPRPKYVNGIELVYTPSIETKFLSQIINSFFSFVHVCFSNIDIVLVVNSANGPFGILTKIFNKKTCINVDGLEWLRPKWRGIGSVYFRLASKLSTILFNKIITDSFKMNEIYNDKFKKNSAIIAYGSTMTNIKNRNILDKYNLSEKSYYLIVGRLIPDNNSKLILEGFLKSNSSKKIVIVGDVPYKDEYAEYVKGIKSDKIIFTGYVNSQSNLSCLYENCFGYVHGHEFGGTNPTMINALFLNCEVIALNTMFNREMLQGKESVFFEKSIQSIYKSFQFFDKKYNILKEKNKNYLIPQKYTWEYIVKKYIKVFYQLTNL
tara:strand:- start:252 stop:1358 length:1107 start_codon:yes stop_codon:yes gene_type:complete